MLTSRKLFCVLLLVSSVLSNGCPSPQPSDTQKLFDQVWNTFDQNYSYFEVKDIDWDDVKDDYRPLFSQDLSASVFAERIADMQQELHDWHVWVRKPTGEYLGYDGDYDLNYPSTLYGRYTTQGYTTIGDDVIFHAWVGDDDDIAYIVVDTLDSTAWQGVSDAAIGNMFVTYQNAQGMILDIRANSGGNENNAIKIASRFTHSSVIYGYTKTRNGAGHGDFDPIVTKTLASNAGMHFDGPVVCLIGQRCMSSAEWFALMMRACPNVTLMGDWTRGASGNPQTYSLSNGVTYAVSRWVAFTNTMDVIEDNGIEPDEYFPAGLSYDDTRDYLLEDAIDSLQVL